jgi:hypothetical protein
MENSREEISYNYFIRAIKDMYERASTDVNIHDRVNDDFPITIGLYQWSISNPFLFTLVLGVLAEHIQELTQDV